MDAPIWDDYHYIRSMVEGEEEYTLVYARDGLGGRDIERECVWHPNPQQNI